MSRAVWTRRAQNDLARIDEFNAARDVDYAIEVGRAAVAAGNFLAEFPAAGPIIDGAARKWSVPGTDYVLIYQVAAEGVIILRAYHGRENWRGSR